MSSEGGRRSAGIEALAEQWLKHQRELVRAEGTPQWDAVFDAESELWNYVDSLIESDPNNGLDFVIAALSQETDPVVLACLAAGPLEDLLVNHGDYVIERVEREAKDNVRFRELLSAVWKNAMTDTVWQRVGEILRAA